VHFNVNFNVFFKLIKVHLLVSELYIYQNARCNNKKSRVHNFTKAPKKIIEINITQTEQKGEWGTV
jgi:hypothetical protein